jgi:Tfp pilus assembly protein PilV
VSLLESIIAAAIMVISFTAIYSLIDSANRRAGVVREQSLAMQTAQSLVNEVTAGSKPLSNQAGDCDDYLSGWEWNIQATPHTYDGLWNVHIVVRRKGTDRAEGEAVLDQVVLDPSKRGSAADTVSVSGGSSSSSSSGSSGGSSK